MYLVNQKKLILESIEHFARIDMMYKLAKDTEEEQRISCILQILIESVVSSQLVTVTELNFRISKAHKQAIILMRSCAK